MAELGKEIAFEVSAEIGATVVKEIREGDNARSRQYNADKVVLVSRIDKLQKQLEDLTRWEIAQPKKISEPPGKFARTTQKLVHERVFFTKETLSSTLTEELKKMYDEELIRHWLDSNLAEAC